MKYLKKLFFLLIISIIFSVTGVSATTTYYLNLIEVPYYTMAVTVPGQQSHEDGYQYLKTTYTEDYQSGESRATMARTKEMFGNGNYSSWLHVPNGTIKTWEDENENSNDYKL